MYLLSPLGKVTRSCWLIVRVKQTTDESSLSTSSTCQTLKNSPWKRNKENAFIITLEDLEAIFNTFTVELVLDDVIKIEWVLCFCKAFYIFSFFAIVHIYFVSLFLSRVRNFSGY